MTIEPDVVARRRSQESGIDDTTPGFATPRSAPRRGESGGPGDTIPSGTSAGIVTASQARLFWEAVARLVEWRNTGRAGSTGRTGRAGDTGDAGGAEEVPIDHLDAAAGGLDPRLRAGVRKLHDTFASLTGLDGASAGELFERHDTPVAHAMTFSSCAATARTSSTTTPAGSPSAGSPSRTGWPPPSCSGSATDGDG